MRYVIFRDDDTNALTPVECLEKLYRPFLQAGIPVNLATIPAVSTSATMADGRSEGFLIRRNGETRPYAPMSSNPDLLAYLRANPGYRIVQHGCHHDYLEFDQPRRDEAARRLELGARLLKEAGLGCPGTFVAPYDKLSRASLEEVSRRFRVLSTGWFELRRLPYAWWPRYAWKKLRKNGHWQVGNTLLLTHPGCLLSCNRTYATMLGGILEHLQHARVTVLVTHWWEYFRSGEPDEPFIDFLHETAAYIAANPDLKAVSFSELADNGMPLN